MPVASDDLRIEGGMSDHPHSDRQNGTPPDETADESTSAFELVQTFLDTTGESAAIKFLRRSMLAFAAQELDRLMALREADEIDASVLEAAAHLALVIERMHRSEQLAAVELVQTGP
jgi:hypothetical protein